MIRKIIVNKILGEFDYILELDRKVKIIIGPNGCGKTTFLKIISAVLTNNHLELYDLEFSEIEFVMDDKNLKIVKESRDDFETLESIEDINDSSFDNINYYIDNQIVGNLDKDEELPSFMYFARHIPLLVRRRDYVYDRHTLEVFTAKDKLTILKKYSDYLPTKFEMIPSKVKEIIDKYDVVEILTNRLISGNLLMDETEEIAYQPPTVEFYKSALMKKINNQTFSYAEFSQKLDQQFPMKIIEAFEIADSKINLVNEVNELINSVNVLREKIVDTGLFDVDEENDEVYMNSNIDNINLQGVVVLLEYYQSMLDKLRFLEPFSNKIELFLNLFNKKIKLSGKKCIISYKDGLNIINKNDNKIPFSRLSSGEQHEFIQLYRLIFDTNDGAIVLIDEPEISLHVSWQREYIDDLCQMIYDKKNIRVVIATHSVQIVNDNWDDVLDLGEVE